VTHLGRLLAAPGVPVILDAKRGDIGSTAAQYAIKAFERHGADAVTLSPFMGFDSVQPYLTYHGKGAFLLCRISNPGGDDLQNQRLAQEPSNSNGQLGLVVGATYPAEIERVRAGWRPGARIIVNSSRAILYASAGDDFSAAARREATRTRDLLEAARQAI
jgi:orotidine-5'-phosphate decarboxylase